MSRISVGVKLSRGDGYIEVFPVDELVSVEVSLTFGPLALGRCFKGGGGKVERVHSLSLLCSCPNAYGEMGGLKI